MVCWAVQESYRNFDKYWGKDMCETYQMLGSSGMFQDTPCGGHEGLMHESVQCTLPYPVPGHIKYILGFPVVEHVTVNSRIYQKICTFHPTKLMQEIHDFFQ